MTKTTQISHKKSVKFVLFPVLFSIVLRPCYDLMTYVQEGNRAQARLQQEQCECRCGKDGQSCFSTLQSNWAKCECALNKGGTFKTAGWELRVSPSFFELFFPAPMLRLSVNVLEAVRLLRQYQRCIIGEPNKCEWISQLHTSRACRSDILITTQVPHSTK